VLLEQGQAPLAQLDAACQQAASDARHAGGKLRATVISPVACLYLVPLLPLFQQRYPEIELELELSEDTSPLTNKRFDVGIRICWPTCRSLWLPTAGCPKRRLPVEMAVQAAKMYSPPALLPSKRRRCIAVKGRRA